jgi:hypothetical protein
MVELLVSYSYLESTVPTAAFKRAILVNVTASVKMIRFSYSNEDIKDEEEERRSGGRVGR